MNDRPQLTQELLEQLRQLDQSLYYIKRLIAGVALSYCATLKQRERLLAGAADEPAECLPDPVPLQTGSSLLILTALFFFAKQSRRVLEQAGPEQRCSAEIGFAGSQLVLAVALARLADLLRVTCSPAAPEAAAAQDAAADEEIADVAAV